MDNRLSRRDFLKLASLLPLVPVVPRLPALQGNFELAQPAPANLIIILFDALSAANLALYGYPRQNCPNLERFARQATVFHNHHTAGNFTTPSTASLFTGTYPWTHRAFSLSGLIQRTIQPNTLFSQLSASYYQFAFTQNVYADMLLHQLHADLDRHERLDRFSLAGNTQYSRLFNNDGVYAMKSLDQLLFKREEAHGSLFLSILNDLNTRIRQQIHSQRLADLYPSGLPRLANTDVYFSFPQVTDGIINWLPELKPPFLAYLHLMPPHEPYIPARPFLGQFNDGWAPPAKKRHRLASRLSDERLNARRQLYDEFILNLDHEFGRLLDYLEESGLRDNSYILFTSDHGELFERGIHGHSTQVLFEPVIRVPLVISAPGQAGRQDVYDLTSNVDLLPTFLQLVGRPVPDWCEGQPLPGLGGHSDPERSIFVVEAKRNPAHLPLSKVTLGMMKGRYKLVHYRGYANYSGVSEFYDLETDPEELQNIYPDHPQARVFQEELEARLSLAEEPYREKS